MMLISSRISSRGDRYTPISRAAASEEHILRLAGDGPAQCGYSGQFSISPKHAAIKPLHLKS